VVQQPGDELPADLAELVGRARLVERVAVTLEQRQVGVHPGSGMVGERLGHEGREDPLLERDLLDDRAEGHDVVGRREAVRVAEVDLVLPGGHLVVAELHRDAHALQHRDGRPAEVMARPVRDVVEVACLIHRDRRRPGVDRLLEEEELHLGVGVEGEPEVGGWPGCA